MKPLAYIKEPFEGRNSIKTSDQTLGMRKALVSLRMSAISQQGLAND
ncbi:MAG: hypothetical protein IPJ03_22445 [Ignavibacteriales bacterium]|nr:hypothetical protein [Ignavibacteriales bacterium]